MPAPDSQKRTEDGAIVEFRTRIHNARVFRQAYDRSSGDKEYAKSWILKKSVAKEAGAFRLGYDMRTAEKLADEICAFLSIPTNTVAMAVERYNPRRMARGIATIGECLDAFEGARAIIGRRGRAVGVNTMKIYRIGLLKLVRHGLAHRDNEEIEDIRGRRRFDYSPWLNQSTTVLTSRLINDFKLSAVAASGGDEEEMLSSKITADSSIQCARAIFSPRAQKYFRELGMKLPDLKSFLEEPNFGAKKYFELLSPSVIEKIMRDALELCASDPQAYKAFLLCAHCGLRAGEAVSFSPEWLRMEDQPVLGVRIRGEFNPKGGKGRKVLIEPWVMAELQKGGVTDLEAFERLTQWLRDRIPVEARVFKPLHELRKCWVSVKAKTEGLLAASQQAGHSDPKVTQTHYGDNKMPDRLLSFWQENPDARSA